MSQDKPARYAPFAAHKKGIQATGTVKTTRMHDDGKTGEITVRHVAPKPPTKPKNGMVGMYDYHNEHESTHTMPAALMPKFKSGQNVQVSVQPVNERAEDNAAAGDSDSPTKKSGGKLIRNAVAAVAKKAGK